MSKPRLGASKRVAAGLLAGALSVFGVALAPSAGATEDVTTERLAGATRYGTAAAIAADEAFAAPTMAIVASGENANLADALAASTLAGANAPAPIILTQTNTYTAEAKSGLAALKGKGVSRVTIVGGTAAVSQAVEDAIEADGFTVTRLAGVNRFGTAAAIAQSAGPGDPIAGKNVAFIASGFSFADALAGSPAAAHTDAPMLLVNSDSVPSETRAALDALDINQAVILGGTVPVSEAVAAEIQAITGAAPQRLAGATRFSTATAIADYEVTTLGFAATSAILANGRTLVDALTSGPLGGLIEAPVLLVEGCTAEAVAWLDAHSDTVAKLYIAGGTAVIDEATVACMVAAAETTANDPARPGASQTAALGGPEAADVSVTDIDLDFDTLEIEYTFCFDSEIDDDAVNEGSFKLYDTNNNVVSTGNEADVSGNCVAVKFDLSDPATASATLAGIEAGAVQDEDGNENPPQSITITPLSPTPNHLTDIELTDEDQAVATFTFNSVVYPEAVTAGQYSFFLVEEDGDVHAGTDEEAVPDDDDPSREYEVTFPTLVDDEGDPNDPDFDDVVRGFVRDNATGVIYNVDISGGGDTEKRPDLEGVDLPADNGDLDDDEVLFSFDEEIDTADASEFFLYYGVDGSQPLAGTAIVDIDGGDVTVQFDEEGVNDYVAGAFVRGGAAFSDGDSNDDEGDGAACAPSCNPNRPDGEFLGFTAKAGFVLGPQLSGVEVIEETDSFGEFEEFQVVFTFDKDLDDTTGTSGFSVYFDEDDEVTELELSDCEVDDDRTVVCVDDDEDSDIALAEVGSVDAGAVETDPDDDLNFGNGDISFPNPEGSFEIENEATA